VETQRAVLPVTSFEVFVREHSTNLLRTSFLLTGDLGRAEDLLQDVLTRLYPNWYRVDTAEAPVAYVRRCLLNEYLNSRRRRTVQLVDFDLRDHPGSVPDLVDGLADRDETTRLLTRLNDRQRAAVILRYFHSLSDSEIAAMLGCREATVRSLLRRALISMRAAYGAVPSETTNRRNQ
jgi:RNA polymerase sigma-70 factor (sigma-E family)